MKEVRDILEARARWSREELVMGTVVDVAGSAYRQPGARMLLRRSGERVGLISGGCLERDVARQAFEHTEDGPKTVMYDTRGDRIHPQGRYGTGCDGVVHLFLERLGADGGDPAVEALTKTLEQRRHCVLATLFAGTGECAGWVGEKVVVDDPEQPIESDLPPAVRTHLGDVMADAWSWHRPRTLRLEYGDDRASFLVEPIRPPLDLLLFGAGDDAQPVVQMAQPLGWDVRVADHRPVWTSHERFPTAQDVICAPPQKLVDKIRVDADTHAVLMTHDFEADAELLPALLDQNPAFVGLLGPRRRTMRLMEQLHQRGRLPDPKALESVQTPLGLDVGGEAPSEVAVSIISGVLAAHHGRQGGFLQAESAASIHDEHQRLTRTVEEGAS